MKFRSISVASVLLLAGACKHHAPQSQIASAHRGEYLVHVIGCADCHNSGALTDHPEQGFLEGANVGFEVPGMGVFYPPNLTPDANAGIGKWTKADIVRALRTGKTPEGRILAPVMPWQDYSALSDEDANAIAAFLKSLPPSGHRAPPTSSRESAPAPYETVVAPSGHASAKRS